MNKHLAAVSIVGNLVLIGGLLWMRADCEDQVRNFAQAVMRGDEVHLHLHARSLAALESGDAAEAVATADVLRTMVAAGEVNMEARRRAGLMDR